MTTKDPIVPSNSNTVVESQMARLGHLPALDTLRGVAALTVFVFHYTGTAYRFNKNGYDWDGNWRKFDVTQGAADYLLYPLTLGWCGVSLFFVLSGFVIHLSMATRLDSIVHIRAFYWRRFTRIYPAYLVALAVGIILTRKTLHFDQSSVVNIALHIVNLHNYRESTFVSIVPSFWSLAVEVQFYALYPVAACAARKHGMGSVLVSSLLLSVFVRSYLTFVYPCRFPIDVYWASVPVLWFDWLLGAYMADRYMNGKTTFGTRPWFSALGFALLCITCSLHLWTNGFTFSLASLSAAALVDGLTKRPRRALPVMSVSLAKIGVISYSVYLFHQPILWVVTSRSQVFGFDIYNSFADMLIVGLVTAALTTCVSIVMYMTIERWGIRLGTFSRRTW